MMETQRTEAADQEVLEHGRTPRHLSWPRGFRLIAAEFLVVVSGVLVALALNAFYQGRLDAEREAGYLQQLAADLDQSETALDEALAGTRVERAKVMRLLALIHAEEVPPKGGI